jgi:hypothetical protein
MYGNFIDFNETNLKSETEFNNFNKKKREEYAEKLVKASNIKENLENDFSEYSNDALTDMVVNLSRYEDTEDMIEKVKAELAKRKDSKNINEGKGKKSNVHKRIQELEKQNEVLALEAKITALDEAIDELKKKVELSESQDLADMMDERKINELKKVNFNNFINLN